ncbi:MAG: type II secretion system protein [Verrucomicrobiae bacterium]|nr:type II secretion system protein [Verrucomicrobiae bacterium]
MISNLQKRSVPSGFTLIELLVVTAIIGLLCAMLSPALKSARNSARSMACVNNLRQIGFATRSYIDEHDGFLPDQTDRMNYFIGEKLRPYLNFGLPKGTGTSAILCCPAQNPHANNGGYIIDYGHCCGAFGVNSTYCPKKHDSEIAADTFVLIDAYCVGGDYLNKDFYSTISYRHNGFANVLFYDNHVEPRQNITGTDRGWSKDSD